MYVGASTCVRMYVYISMYVCMYVSRYVSKSAYVYVCV